MTIEAVLSGQARWHLHAGDCLPWLQSLPEQCVDFVVGSPPYMDARLYLEGKTNLGVSRDCRQWVEWMLEITVAATRVCRGLVCWVCAGVTRDHCYWPGCEGLLWEWWSRGGQCWRPCYWHRVGIPGSGGKQQLRADVEYVLVFKGQPGPIPWADNTAMGYPPKFNPGGDMSHRTTNGQRKNQKRKNHVQGGQEQHYDQPVIANPGNRIEQSYTASEVAELLERFERCDHLHTNVGGGQMGSKLAHQNEAPYPEEVPEWLIRTWCPPGGIVLDPFSGSGTTGAVAIRWGRRFLGCDLRPSQVAPSEKRIADEVPMALLEGL